MTSTRKLTVAQALPPTVAAATPPTVLSATPPTVAQATPPTGSLIEGLGQLVCPRAVVVATGNAGVGGNAALVAPVAVATAAGLTDLAAKLRALGPTTAVVIGGVAVVGGATVTTWTDPKTGFVFTWNGAKPDVISGGLNGIDTVRFNGTTQELLGSAQPTNCHVFAVLKHVTDANGPWFASGSDTSNFISCAQLSSQPWLRVHVSGSSVGRGQAGAVFHDTAWHVLDMNGFAASNSGNCIRADNVSKDTGTDGQGGYGGTNKSALGSNGFGSFANVEIAALAIYSSELASSARDAAHALLQAAFAL